MLPEQTTEPTRTHDTNLKYLLRANQLITRFARENNMKFSNLEDDYDAIANCLVALSKNCRYSTIRQYRAALIFYMNCRAVIYRNRAEDIRKAQEKMKSVTHTPKCTIPVRTSAKKQKNISLEDYQSLINFLSKKNDCSYPWAYANLTSMWFALGIQFGLRPKEWFSAKLVSDESGKAIFLKVKNAKFSNGRSYSEWRNLDIRKVDPQTVVTLKNFFSLLDEYLSRAREQGETQHIANYLYSACRTTLRRACLTLWPTRKTHPTLYTARHQFSANAKFSNFSKDDVAILHGHVSPNTATKHYGKKRCGHSAISVLPSDIDRHNYEAARIDRAPRLEDYSPKF